MRVARGRLSGAPSEHRTATFTGGVWADPILANEDGAGVATVIFQPGARTNWHRHEVGQVLCVTHGEGRLQLADGTGSTLTAGDVAHIPAGEIHWHGAAPDSLLVHTAISMGVNEWLEPVSDADYRGAFTDAPSDPAG